MADRLAGTGRFRMEYLIAGGSVALLSFIVWGPSLSSKKKGASGVIAGLYNPRKLCFVNSLVQSLASCQPLSSWLQTRLNTRLEQLGERKASLLYQLHQLLMVVNCRHPTIETDAFSCEGLLSALKDDGWFMRAGEEQDAHEFFQLLAAHIDPRAQSKFSDRVQRHGLESVSVLKSNTHSDGAPGREPCSGGCSPGCVLLHRVSSCRLLHCQSIRRPPTDQLPFLGSLTTHLVCQSCSYKCPVSSQQFVSLSLCVPADWGRAVQPPLLQRSLRSLLNSFTTPEVVSDVVCDCCHTRGRFTKRTLIGKCPNVLCLHLSRLQWLHSGQTVKVTDHVTFPDRLSLDPFTLSHVTRSQVSLPLSGTGSRFPAREPQYRLCAVIVHTGGPNDGHFYTYRVRHTPSNTRWYRVSDLSASRVLLDEVLNSCAYMLFYERCCSPHLSNSSSQSV